MFQEDEKTAKIKTSRLDIEHLNQFFESLEFCRLPKTPRKTTDQNSATTWRIVLICLNSNRDPLALEIYDNITLGRTLGEVAVDLDLTPYMALELGVSREHATLQPSEQTLLLYDRNSTNGTFHNFKSVSVNAPQKVENNDIISFGALNFQVKVIRYPQFAV